MKTIRSGRRAIGAALLGGALGAAISVVYDVAESAGRRECLSVNTPCFGTAPVVGFVGGVAVVIIVCWAGFAALEVRPLTQSVPLGVGAFAVATVVYMAVVAVGHLIRCPRSPWSPP
ncbi:hypothetical protein [Spongiactinospora sp. TRM90649]|uniref:hypothetical protein n=1 Tax=Spongiactinospora sp. TRM90649 TaxID=3031114 RepID=UPI0023F7E7F4|nr:hypothetical protein [Spongiactinospora sp. TRM90649]MDF5751094.1 hypothetical protein [Spongiactinospora sp. TRM90649]